MEAIQIKLFSKHTPFSQKLHFVIAGYYDIILLYSISYLLLKCNGIHDIQFAIIIHFKRQVSE